MTRNTLIPSTNNYKGGATTSYFGMCRDLKITKDERRTNEPIQDTDGNDKCNTGGAGVLDHTRHRDPDMVYRASHIPNREEVP